MKKIQAKKKKDRAEAENIAEQTRAELNKLGITQAVPRNILENDDDIPVLFT